MSKGGLNGPACWAGLGVLLVVLVGGGCGSAELSADAAPVVQEYVVEGMHCEGCEQALAQRVGSLPGVTGVMASHADGQVSVTGTAATVSADVISGIGELGYKAVLQSPGS